MKIRDMVFCALFAALTAVAAQILLPLPFTPIPVSMALLVPMLAGRLLGFKRGVISQLLYVLLGLLGLPVFASMRSGAGVLFGPTGGYIIGYIITAAVCGLAWKNDKGSFWKGALSMLLGAAGCYLCGTVWYIALTQTGFLAALMACVVPFLPGEAIKIVAGAYLVKKVEPIFKNWA